MTRMGAALTFAVCRRDIRIKERFAIGISQLGLIVGAVAVGIAFREGHHGLIGKAEEISILVIVCVALVSPTSAKKVLVTGGLAAVAVGAAHGFHIASASIPHWPFSYVESIPLVMVVLAAALLVRASRRPRALTMPEAQLPILKEPSNLPFKLVPGLILFWVALWLAGNGFYLTVFHETAVLLAFGIIILLVRAVVGVTSVFVVVLSYVLAIGLVSLTGQTTGLILVIAVAIMLLLVISFYAAYLRFLQRQELSHQVVYDIVATFSTWSVFIAFTELSGPEGLRHFGAPLTGSAALIAASLLAAVLIGLLSLSAPLLRAGHRSNGGTLSGSDVFTEVSTITSYQVSPLHGFHPNLQVTLVSAAVVVTALLVSLTSGLRMGHLNAHDFTLAVAIQALALAIVSINFKSVAAAAGLAAFIGIAVIYTTGKGEFVVWFPYGLIGLVAIALWSYVDVRSASTSKAGRSQ